MAGDERVRARVMGSRETVGLTEGESWRLLGGVSLGRVVFTHRAMPVIRPVNHVVDEGKVIFRSHLGAAIVEHAGSADGTVVCYEADEIDAERHTGWSVIVTGFARLVRDPGAVARYERRLRPWVDRRMDYVVAVAPVEVTGLRLVGWCR